MIGSEGSEEQRARWLMAQLLHYHRREEKPVWWAYFNRLEMSPEELVEDARRSASSPRTPAEPPIIDKRSLIYTLRFREQEHKLAPGAEIRDVETEREVDVVDDRRRRTVCCASVAGRTARMSLSRRASYLAARTAR